MPRKVRQEPTAADVDRETTVRRVRQLSLRLRMCVPQVGDELRPRVQRRLQDIGQITDPDIRLARLLDLADEIRPLLPPDVAKCTLPASFEQWRV